MKPFDTGKDITDRLCTLTFPLDTIFTQICTSTPKCFVRIPTLNISPFARRRNFIEMQSPIGSFIRKCIIPSSMLLTRADNVCRPVGHRPKTKSAFLGRRIFLYKNEKIHANWRWPISSAAIQCVLIVRIYRSLGSRSDRMHYGRNAVMQYIWARGALQCVFGHAIGLIEASSRCLICAACTRSDWAISRATVND